MSADTTEQEGAEGDKSVLQRWKWAIIVILAIPSLLFSDTLATGAGKMFGSIIGMALIVYVATKGSRRVGISEWFQPRTWKAIAGFSIFPGFFVAAEPQSMAFHGFGVAFFYLFIAGVLVKGLREGSSKVSSAVQ